VIAALFLSILSVPRAFAGEPHFINNAFDVSRDDNTLTVSGKEAGLGDELQIHVVVSATALCINGGGNHPKAVNKADLTAAEDVPVQNGKAEWSIDLIAVFQPECSPPMTVEFTDVSVTDETNGLTHDSRARSSRSAVGSAYRRSRGVSGNLPPTPRGCGANERRGPRPGRAQPVSCSPRGLPISKPGGLGGPAPHTSMTFQTTWQAVGSSALTTESTSAEGRTPACRPQSGPIRSDIHSAKARTGGAFHPEGPTHLRHSRASVAALRAAWSRVPAGVGQSLFTSPRQSRRR